MKNKEYSLLPTELILQIVSFCSYDIIFKCKLVGKNISQYIDRLNLIPPGIYSSIFKKKFMQYTQSIYLNRIKELHMEKIYKLVGSTFGGIYGTDIDYEPHILDAYKKIIKIDRPRCISGTFCRTRSEYFDAKIAIAENKNNFDDFHAIFMSALLHFKYALYNQIERYKSKI